MKPLRVAYDVSFCGEFHGRSSTATGVGRVIENVASRLVSQPGVELCMTGCYGGDARPAFTSAKARRYWLDRWAGEEGISFLEATDSRTGAFALYRDALVTANHADAPSFTGKLRRKGLNAFSKWDTSPRSLGNEIDLFHSPFHPLPARHLVGIAPRILTVHDLIPLSGPDSWSRRLTEVMLDGLDPACDWAITVSDYTRRALCSATGLPAERTAVIPLAAEPVFRPNPDGEILARIFGRSGRNPGPYFLSVANPQPRKNIPLLIRCFAELARQPGFESMTLLLAGAPKLGFGVEEIDAQIAKFPEVKERIIRLGGVSDDELSVLYTHCTAFVFPSAQEGFGLPPLEAMQCGAPVICSNATSLPEVTGDAALLLSPDDEGGFLKAMEAVAGDAGLRSRLSQAGIRQASRFSWDQTAKATLDFYRKATSR